MPRLSGAFVFLKAGAVVGATAACSFPLSTVGKKSIV